MCHVYRDPWRPPRVKLFQRNTAESWSHCRGRRINYTIGADGQPLLKSSSGQRRSDSHLRPDESPPLAGALTAQPQRRGCGFAVVKRRGCRSASVASAAAHVFDRFGHHGQRWHDPLDVRSASEQPGLSLSSHAKLTAARPSQALHRPVAHRRPPSWLL